MFDSSRMSPMDMSASALYATRRWMNTIANNMANIHTTNAQETMEEVNGVKYTKYTPYRRKTVLFQVGVPGQEPANEGVSVQSVVEDASPFRKVYDPNHPHAVTNPQDADFGYVLYPNVDPMVETVNMILASRAYEANVAVIDAFKSRFQTSLRLLA